jgi:hypothetical protein
MISMINSNLTADLRDIEFDRDRKMRKCTLQKEVIIKSADRLIALTHNLDKTDRYADVTVDGDSTILKAGDIVKVLVDNPQSSRLRKGALETIDRVSDEGKTINIRGWSVNAKFFKLYDYSL